MKRCLLVLVLVSFAAAALAAPVEPLLLERMADAKDGERLGVMIALKRQLDAENIIRTVKDKAQRWELTVSSLKEMALVEQAGLLAELRQYQALGRVGEITPLWIVNAVYCEAAPDVILKVAERPEVWFVQWDLIPTENALGLAPATAGRDVTDGSFTIEWNVRKVKADSVWFVHGYTGDGVVIGNIDTGCDYTHPDLAGHMWTDPNYPNHGWNFEQNNNNPMDAHGHGTHTCGTNAGDGTAGDTTGMAPKARIMTCRTKTSISQPYPDTIAENTVMNSMQFCVAPPLNPANHAHVLSMSLGWLHSWSPRRALWRQSVTNVAAAGLPYFIAAGNEASTPPPHSCRTPGDCPGPWKHPAEAPGGLGGTISIGATDINDNIASFSSRGPVAWDTIAPYYDYPMPTGLLHPDFSAPGVDVTSCRLGGGYTQMSGTSMATPCAAGIAALMLEKNPNLLPEDVDEIMQNSVLPLGSQPKNNTYGTGRIDAMRCIENTPLPFGVRFYRAIVDDSAGGNNDRIINPGEAINLPVWVKNQCNYTTQGLWLTLRTLDANITITDSLKHIATIPQSDTAFTGQNGFKFQVATSCTNGYALKFELAVRDTMDSVWYSGVVLKVGEPRLAGDSVYAYDGGNGKLDPGEECDIAIQLVNSGLGNAYNVSVVLRSADARFTVLDSLADYGLIPADSWVMNSADHFRVSAASSIPNEFVVPCTLVISQTGYPVQRKFFGIEVGRLTAIDPIPDGPRQPALYYAYDDADSAYTEAPDFNWVEIRGLGTRLTLSDDQTVQINLPSGFGPWVFYGQSFTQVSICGNGWVAPGSSTVTTYLNTVLPNSSMPPAVFLNWDDLYPPTGNGVWYYHDAANHRFIVEWDSVHYYNPREQWEKNQVVIYDTTRAAADGNCEFVFQYLTANRTSSATVGEQDPTRTIAIQALFDGTYHRASSAIVAGRAIKFTTDAPQTGIAEEAGLSGLGRARFAVWPTLVGQRAQVRFGLGRVAQVKLSVYDLSGREVRQLVRSVLEPGTHDLVWNGCDDAGRRLAQGVYVVRLDADGEKLAVKTVLLK
ncbi:MAG: S8 family serine peptidase [candidate division WOR-3 bacterium]